MSDIVKSDFPISEPGNEVAATRTEPLTLAALARAKKLPTRLFLKLGIHDLPGGGVGIPYYDETAFELGVKRRTALKAKDGSYWPRGHNLSAYGRWKIQEASESGVLILVEGESDCWTLWHHDLPALGLPSSSTAKTLTRDLLVDVKKLYIQVEPDQGGQTFAKLVTARLMELHFEGQAFFAHMPQGIKDISELYCDDPDKFSERLLTALHAARPVSLARLRVAGADRSGGTPCKGVTAGTTALQGVPPDAPHSAPRLFEPQQVTLVHVPSERVAFLWGRRLPLGKLTILDGDPGLGKSTLALDLAARLTRGVPMPADDPAQTPPPGKVVLLSAEDGLGDTIRPRLEAAGADLDQVIALTCMAPAAAHVLPADGPVTTRPVSLPLDITALQKVVGANQARLVIIDPLMAYLDEDVHAHNDQSVRRALLPLSQLAEQTGAAVLVLRHLNKQAGRHVMYRSGGSIGIIGAARSGLIVCKDPDVPERRLVGVFKSNLCKPARTLRYELEDCGGASRIRWLNETDHDIEEVFAAREEGEETAAIDAEEFLRMRLAQGPAPAREILEEAAGLALAPRTLKRAKKRLGVASDFVAADANTPAHWLWSLPA